MDRSVICRNSDFSVFQVGEDAVSRFHFFLDNHFADAVFEVLLDGSAEGSCAKLLVVALLGYELLCFLADGEVKSEFVDAPVESLELDADDLEDGVEFELVEGDDFVDSVEELGRELLVEGFLDDGSADFLVVFACHGRESYATAELLELPCAHVAGNYDDGVAKIMLTQLGGHLYIRFITLFSSPAFFVRSKIPDFLK